MADNADEGVFDPAVIDPDMAGNPEPPAPAPELQEAANEANQVGGAIAEPVLPIPPAVAFLGQAGAFLRTLRVANRRDVYNRLMEVRQHGNICVLSATGSLSVVTLRRVINGAIQFFEHEGNFDIISLSGSYLRNDWGIVSGGLGVCYSPTNGDPLRAGVVGGTLIAAGPVVVTYIIFGEALAPIIMPPPPPRRPPHKRPPPSDGSQGTCSGSRPLQRRRVQ